MIDPRRLRSDRIGRISGEREATRIRASERAHLIRASARSLAEQAVDRYRRGDGDVAVEKMMGAGEELERDSAEGDERGNVCVLGDVQQHIPGQHRFRRGFDGLPHQR